MAYADWEVRFLKHIAKEARHHSDERDRSKGYLQAHSNYPSPTPNGLRLSGERSGAERVRCSRGFGARLLDELDATSGTIRLGG